MAEHAVSLATRSVALPPRYECLLEIEQGGGGRCHLAIASGAERAPASRRLVAVHRAPPEVEADDELRARFAARAAAFLPLHHPNLVTTYGAFSERRPCHWVTEFVPGQPLPRLLEKTRGGGRALSTRKILAILCDVARALEYAHGAVDAARLPRPVVHGDLCPASVLVTYDGVVKVSGEIDLRLLNERPQRAIDKQDPYSP